jgi:hypothetical protein
MFVEYITGVNDTGMVIVGGVLHNKTVGLSSDEAVGLAGEFLCGGA